MSVWNALEYENSQTSDITKPVMERRLRGVRFRSRYDRKRVGADSHWLSRLTASRLRRKSFNSTPYDDLADYGNWGQDSNDSTNDTPRTRALFGAYLVLSGGRIPLRGIEIQGAWFRPDQWVAGALMKKGYLIVDEGAGEFIVTREGWDGPLIRPSTGHFLSFIASLCLSP